MRSRLTVMAWAAILLLAACGKGPDADDVTKQQAVNAHEAKDSGDELALTSEQAEAMGLGTVKLEATVFRTQLTGYGTVLSFEGLAQLQADIATADATAAQTAAAASRANELTGGEEAAVSREVSEGAAARAANDHTAALLARRKLDATFGTGAPWHNNPARLDAVLTRLQSGRSVLVKVTFPIGAVTGTPPFAVARVGEHDRHWETVTTWAAPSDGAVPGRSLHALVEESDLTPGEHLLATLEVGEAQQGVLVPATALVLGEGDAWVYVRQGDHYARTRIDTTHARGDSYFVTAGLEPGDEVVTTGAGQLYAREINPSTTPED